MSETEEIRARLIEAGGITSQDLGLGRIFGQILMSLYLSESERSLDELGDELGLSKAAVSISARQLESLGLVRRVWRQGDRKCYYRSADDLGSALQRGVLSVVERKMDAFRQELDAVDEIIQDAGNGSNAGEDDTLAFLSKRVGRARELHGRADRILGSRIVRMLLKRPRGGA